MYTSLSELIILSLQSDRIVPYFGGLFPDEPLPANGVIQLPDRYNDFVATTLCLVSIYVTYTLEVNSLHTHSALCCDQNCPATNGIA